MSNSPRHDGGGGRGGGYDREERGVSILYQYEIQTGSTDGECMCVYVCMCGSVLRFPSVTKETGQPLLPPSPLMKRASPRK